MSPRTQQFLEIYSAARVEDQRTYYERTAKTFETARRRVLLVSSVVFGFAAAAGLIAGLDVPGKLVWAVLAAILPAFTTALTAYDGLYGFERVGKLNRDAARNLRRIEPPSLDGTRDEQQTAVAQYVATVEQIFEHERSQWGQLQLEVAAGPDVGSGKERVESK